VTLYFSEKASANGKPTYPSPIIPIFNSGDSLVSILSQIDGCKYINQIRKYILNQPQRGIIINDGHRPSKKTSTRGALKGRNTIPEKCGVEYDERYVWD